MSTTAGTVLTDVWDRIRDASGQLTATSNPPTTASGTTFGLSIISACQQIAAIYERQLVASGSIVTSSTNAIYSPFALFADYGGKVLSVNLSGTGEIDGPVDWRALGRAVFNWPVATGTKLLGWAPIGQLLLAIVPVIASSPPTVTVRYTQLATAIALTSTNMSVPDDLVEQIARMSELVLRIKSRQLSGFDILLKQLQQDMQLSKAEEATDSKAD